MTYLNQSGDINTAPQTPAQCQKETLAL